MALAHDSKPAHSRFRILLPMVAGVIFSAVSSSCWEGPLSFSRACGSRGKHVRVCAEHGFNVLDPAQGFKLYVASHAFMTVNASVILGLAFMFSCFNMKPAAATILSLSFPLRIGH